MPYIGTSSAPSMLRVTSGMYRGPVVALWCNLQLRADSGIAASLMVVKIIAKRPANSLSNRRAIASLYLNVIVVAQRNEGRLHGQGVGG